MKWPRIIGQSLGGRLLVSYLVIIAVALIVLVGAANFHAGTAIQHHIADMEAALQGGSQQAPDLLDSFHQAINEVMLVAILAGSVAAIAVSAFTSRRITQPLRAMTQASQRIAGGDYHQRVPVVSDDELGDLAESFNRMAAALEQTEQRRLDLIGNVAHELRTPLSNIRSTLEALTDGVLAPEPATFLNVQHETARLQRLVQDLEELSRAEAGQIPLKQQAVAIGELIEAAVARLHPQFGDKGVSLRSAIGADLPAVWADPGRITQVLLNLLGNALQYTPPGGDVVVQANQQYAQVLVVVKDSGIGIAESDLPHIFERFYRAEKSRSRVGGGSGIGLTISKHLVEAHGGRIWAQSLGPGQGSSFFFTLPLAS
ncbi:MAG: HAMP domain-containing protein [Caldilineales bacterium]|nr:HAMP domain-containing protein [Caldilineales bacterium]